MRKVLLLRLSSLGDIVHATSAFAPLRAAGAEIHFLVKPEFSGLLEACAPGVRVHTYKKSTLGEAKAKEDLFAWVAAEKFDFILDLHDTLRTFSWRSRLRKIAPVFVARKPRLREFLVYILRMRSFGLGNGGRARLMRNAAVRAAREIWNFNFAEKSGALTELSSGSARLPAEVPSGEFSVIVPGSAWEGKRWPDSKFAELARELARTRPVVVLGGKKEDYCETIAAAAKEVAPASVSLHGRTSMAECAAILAEASLIVGNDTGLVHLAEALGKDVTAIEGPTHPALGYSVYRPGSRLLSANLVCRPCSKNGRVCWRFGRRTCMKAILPSAVRRGEAYVDSSL